MPENTRYGFPLEAWEMAKAEANELLQERARERGTITYGEICPSQHCQFLFVAPGKINNA